MILRIVFRDCIITSVFIIIILIKQVTKCYMQ